MNPLPHPDDQVDSLSYITNQLEGATLSKRNRKNRQPKIVDTASQGSPENPNRVISIQDLVKAMHDSPPEPRMTGFLDDRLFRDDPFNLSAGMQDYPATTLENSLTFGKLKEHLALLQGDYAKARELHEQSRIDRPHGSVDPLLSSVNDAAVKLGCPPVTPDQAQDLREVMQKTSMAAGIPLLQLERSLNHILASMGRPNYDEVNRGPAKYKPVVQGMPSDDQHGPTATLQLTLIDTRTGEPVFEMDPLLCSEGANLHLGPVDGNWDHVQLLIKVVSIDPHDFAEEDEEQVPFGTQDLQLDMDTRVCFDFAGTWTRAEVTCKGLIGYGLARCHPEDHYDISIGRKLAFKRALEGEPANGKQPAIAGACPSPLKRKYLWESYFSLFPEDKLARKDR